MTAPVYTSYDPAPGLDPEWDAYMAVYRAKEAAKVAEVARQKARLATEYDTGIRQLELDAPGRRQGTESTLLSRGVGRSSEAMERRAGLESEMLAIRNAATRARTDGDAALEADLMQAYVQLAADRAREIAESRKRISDRGKTPPTPVTDPNAGAPNPAPPVTPPGASGESSFNAGSEEPTTTSEGMPENPDAPPPPRKPVKPVIPKPATSKPVETPKKKKVILPPNASRSKVGVV